MGQEFTQDAEKVLSNKWLWAGVAVAALVGGYFWVSGQLSSIANSQATDGGASSMVGSGNVLPISYSSPLSSIGASSDGGGGGGGSSTSGPTIDPGVLQLEENQAADNLQLGLAQLSSQTSIAQLSAQTAQMGLAVQQQGQSLQIAASLTQALSSLFSKTGNKSTSMNQNLNGSFNVDGTPVGFNVNLNNYQGSANTTFTRDVSNQLGEDNAVTSPPVSGSAQNAPATPGTYGNNVGGGSYAAPGVSSVVARANSGRSNSL